MRTAGVSSAGGGTDVRPATSANVVSQAGTVHQTAVEELRRLSEELGLHLRKRDFFYELID